MSVDVLALAVIVGFLFGGRVQNLGTMPLKGLPWIVALGVLEYGMSVTQTPERRVLYTCLVMASLVIGEGLLWANRRLPGVFWVLIGLLLNFGVMAANGGRMPVSEWATIHSGQAQYLPGLVAGVSGRHVLLTAATRLGFLGDILPVPSPYPMPRVLSIGDVAIYVGIIRLTVWGMSSRQKTP